MDVAVIDWKDSKFEKDQLYEDIDAPQWIDFSDYDPPVDDEVFFCRPDCNHPKTVEDFFRQRSPYFSKLQRSASVSEVPELADRNRRDAALKKRGFPLNKDSKSTKCVHDSENQNPNFSTPPSHKAKSLKDMIKSSSEKNHSENGFLTKEETPRRLKSTLSARNLFAGRDILNQVTGFYGEVKRLATRMKDNGEKEVAKISVIATKGQEKGVLQESENKRKPLLEVKKGEYKEMEMDKHSNNEKLTRKKMICEAENSPMALNMKSIRSKDEERVLQIRTNPPSPQCFSANRGTTKATTPKAFCIRPQERGILQEIEEFSSKEVKNEVKVNTNQAAHVSVSTHNEAAKGLDVFWFFKPCTLSS